MSEIIQTQPGDVIGMFDKLVKTGLFSFGMNEVNLRSLVDDPPKYTLESSSGSLGGWSARYVLPNGSPVELALIQFKKDERTRDRPDVLWGEWTIHIKGPEMFQGDDGMRLVFLCTHDYLWFLGQSGPRVPIVELPPAEQQPIPPPVITPDEQIQRVLDIEAARYEFSPMELDEGKVAAYLQGRSGLREFHDDNVARAGAHRAEFHRPGRPY